MSGRARRLDKLEERVARLRVPRELAERFQQAADLPPSAVASGILGVTLSAPQAAVLDDPARFRLLIAGRRFGKSYVTLAGAVAAALAGPGRVCWVVSPTYRQCRDINWPVLRRLVPPWSVVRAPRETDLSVTFKNGSVVALRSGDEPDNLRGSGLDYCGLDEAAQLGADLWTLVLRPALADREGRAVFATTPRGLLHWIADLWREAETDRAWQRWRFTTAEGGRVSAPELDAARRTLSAQEYRQEFEADFTATGGRVYQDFSLDPWPDGNLDPTAEDGAGIAQPDPDPTPVASGCFRWPGERWPHQAIRPARGEVLIGFDPGMLCGLVYANVTPDRELVVFDAEVLSDSHTQAAAQRIRKRFPDRRIVVYPDPAGQQRRSSAGHLTDHLILRQAGFEVVAPSAAPRVEDRVNAVRGVILSADGRRRVRVHPRAEVLVRALDQQLYDPRTQAPDKKSGHDHVLDALGYLVWSAANLLRERSTVRITPLRI